MCIRDREQTLDDISTGEVQWLPYLQEFYLGKNGLETQVKERESQIDPAEARTVELENLAAKVRIGRFGAYIEAADGDGTVRTSIPKDLTPADLNPQQVETLLRQKTEGPDKLGFHPELGEPIYLLVGTYGPYVQLGDVSDANPKPKRASLPKGVSAEAVTLEEAVGLLSLPRLLGLHPETGGKVQAGLGRFGPYVVNEVGKEKEYRSLKAGDDVLTIDLDRAVSLLNEPKTGRGARGKAKAPLRELGTHPGDQEPVNIYDGPYGPYIKHDKTNVSLPEGETIESVTLAMALTLLAAKEPAKKGRKTTRSSSAASEAASETGEAPAKPKTPRKTAASTSRSTTSKAQAGTTGAKTTKTTAKKTTTKTSTTTRAKKKPTV